MPSDTVITCRQPSTANLMISSVDSALGEPSFNFTINRPNSLVNGFFTRIGVSEVVLDWFGRTINTDASGVIFDVSGAVSIGNVALSLPVGGYSCADALDTIVSLYNALPSATRFGTTIAVTSTGQIVTITMTGGTFRIPAAGNPILLDLGFSQTVARATTQTALTSGAGGSGVIFGNVPLYLDFVSQNLTYNQDLKDSTTNTIVRDVLCRWYMASSNENQVYDKYGYALSMGYKPFKARRTFSPPKQIRWSNSQPIGQLSFQVYDNNNNLANYGVNGGYNWYMTLQISED